VPRLPHDFERLPLTPDKHALFESSSRRRRRRPCRCCRGSTPPNLLSPPIAHLPTLTRPQQHHSSPPPTANNASFLIRSQPCSNTSSNHSLDSRNLEQLKSKAVTIRLKDVSTVSLDRAEGRTGQITLLALSPQVPVGGAVAMHGGGQHMRYQRLNQTSRC
jgi:hypothetical protein